MAAVTNVLVAGAGLAGTAIATHLAAAGVTVDLIDVKPAVTALGSGITMQSNALRELRALGVLDQVTEHGYAFSSLGLRAPDPAGTLLVELPDRSGGDLPGTVGIPRPVLARIVLDRAAQAGATVRLATSCAGLRQDTDGVDVTFADGSAGRYDLVVAADGVRSPTRRMLGIATEPRPTGMGICDHARHRSRLPRPLGRHPPGPDRPVPGQLHLVRDPRGPGAVEPRPGRADRRCRALVPADPRPRRRPGAGGRRGRPGGTAPGRGGGRRGPVGGVSPAAVRPRENGCRCVQPARSVAARPRAGRRPRLVSRVAALVSQPA
jgi:2-polyprenyl-6-methoxyphenol hydroxylase-like FAD-dependent oxidoreductase